MKRFQIFLSGVLVLILCAPFYSSAQVSLDSADVMALTGKSFSIEHYSTDDTAGVHELLEATGTGQTYDITKLSGFSLDFSGSIEYKGMPAETPLSDSDRFKEATIVAAHSFQKEETGKDSTFWIYESVSADSFKIQGSAYISKSDADNDGESPDTLSFSFDPDRLAGTFPLDHQTSWKDTTTFTIQVDTTVVNSQEQRISASVEGSGTLQIPGYSVECLRVDRTVTTTTRFGNEVTSRSVTFLTPGSKPLSATINFSQGDPESISYVTSGEGTGINEVASGDSPERFRLEDNFPNPFNPLTTISYQLKEEAEVNLTVYNALGNKVKTLVNKHQQRGIYKVNFDASGLSSGIYLYRLEAGDFTAVKKMTVLK